jgi:O-antigen ligase
MLSNNRALIFMLLYSTFHMAFKIYLPGNLVVQFIPVLLCMISIFFFLSGNNIYISKSIVPLLFLFVLYAVSLSYTTNTLLGIRALLNFPIYLLLLIGYRIYNSKYLLKKSRTIIIVTTMISAIIAIYQQLYSFNSYEINYMNEGRANYSAIYGTLTLKRAFGLQGGPADLSSFLMIGIIVTHFSKVLLKYKIPIYTFLLLAIIFSLNRGALVAGVLAIVIVIFLNKKRDYVKNITLAIVIILSFTSLKLFTSNFDQINYRFKKSFNITSVSSMQSRSNSWDIFFSENFKEDPIRKVLLGSGAGSYGGYTLLSGNKNTLDNTYLKIFAEIGVIGLVLIIFVHMKIIGGLYYITQKSNDSNMLLCFFIYSSFLFLTSEYIELFPFKIIYVVFMIISLNVLESQKPPRSNYSGISRN